MNTDHLSKKRLVAMVPSGETFISLANGVYFLHQPPGAGGARELTVDEVSRAIARGDLHAVNEDFDGWDALDARRNELVRELCGPLDRDDRPLERPHVEAILRAGERWLRAGETDRVRQLAVTLLDAPAVLECPDLVASVNSLLKRASATAPPSRYSASASGLSTTARQSFRTPVAA